jgi:hypothetical protein
MGRKSLSPAAIPGKPEEITTGGHATSFEQSRRIILWRTFAAF